MKKAFLAVAVALILSSASPIAAWSEDKAPAALQAEFDGFFAKFKAAVKANDAAAVAALTELPFMKDPEVSDAAQFKEKVYKDAFSKKARKCIQREPAMYGRDQEGNESFSSFCDDSIFTFTKTPAGFLFTDLGAND